MWLGVLVVLAALVSSGAVRAAVQVMDAAAVHDRMRAEAVAHIDAVASVMVKDVAEYRPSWSPQRVRHM